MPGPHSQNGQNRPNQNSGGQTKWDAIQEKAADIDSKSPPYSQSNRQGNPGYDCSSACAALMRAAGYAVPWFNTNSAPEYMSSGKDPSGRITFWNNIDSHMFAEIDGRFWGTSVGNSGAGGTGWHPNPSSSYLSGFSPYYITGLDRPVGTPLDSGSGGAAGADGGTGAATGGVLDEATAKAAAFSTYFNIEGLFEQTTSMWLIGEKSLMNDKPLFPFIQQLCAASLRRFQSMPNGNFYAFYPDYFGGAKHREAYWEIDDTEIIDGQIELNDDALATHVFVVGDNTPNVMPNGVDLWDMNQTAGIINIFNAFQADFITGHGTERKVSAQKDKDIGDPNTNTRILDHDEAVTFLKKYGARPYYEEAPLVRSAFYEAFLAYQRFCLLWSQQFATTFRLTFMPELFPGGLVAFPQHGLQMFVEEVSHDFDFTTGFRTSVVFSSPSALNNQEGKQHEGMVRAGALQGK